jgi:hypothetical protein
MLRGTCHCRSLVHLPAGSHHCHCCWFQALITKVSIGLQPAISPQASPGSPLVSDRPQQAGSAAAFFACPLLALSWWLSLGTDDLLLGWGSCSYRNDFNLLLASQHKTSYKSLILLL